jgi:hypothetical protein
MSTPTPWLRLVERLTSPAARWPLLVNALLVWAVGMVVMERLAPGSAIGFWALFPLIAFALQFGLRGAALAALLAHPANQMLRSAMGIDIWPSMFEPRKLVYWGLAFLFALAFGLLRDLALAWRASMLEQRRLNLALTAAQEQLHTVRGLLPICCVCNKIRDEQGDWRRVEDYVEARSPARFTHSYCPTCSVEHFGEDDEE